MPVVQRIQTPKEFWEGLVDPDYTAFIASPGDLRLAFHCAIALFHMADWVYVTHKGTINAAFTFVDGTGSRQAVHDEKTFATALGQAHMDFELVRGIANAAKHLDVRSKKRHPNAANNAANVFVTGASWVSGKLGMGSLGGQPLGQQSRVVLANHPGQKDLEFFDIAKSVYLNWQALNKQHHWW